MRRYRPSQAFSPIVVALAALALVAVETAAFADPGVAVLGIEPVDVPEALTQAVTDALRQRAAATSGIHIVAGKDLVELKMIFGCDTEQTACMAQAGRSLGADKLLYGTLKKQSKSSNNVVVALKLLDVTTGTIEKFVNDTVPKRDLAGGNVNAAAAKWFGALVEVEAKPTLTITSDPPGANLLVDGQQAGRTPVTLRDLTAGTHTLELSLPGHVTATKTVDLRAGVAHEISLQLEAQTANTPPIAPPPVAPEPQVVAPPLQQPTAPPPSGHPGRIARGLAIGAFGAAVISGAVAIYTWRTYRDLEDTTHNDLKNLTPMANANNQGFFNNPNCNPPTSLSGSTTQTYKNHCSSGQTYADATTALWVTAGVLAAAGIVGVVIGDRQAAKARRETQSAARLMQQSLRLAPVFSTQAGGLQASFEF